MEQKGTEEYIVEKGIIAKDLADSCGRYRRERLLRCEPGQQQLRYNGSLFLGDMRLARLEEERMAKEPYHPHG